MARLILATGGCRSGKSMYAQTRAENLRGSRLYIATSPAVDPEMDERIARHKRQRQGRGWQTLEEELNLEEAVAATFATEILLIDCLTLWVNNVLFSRSSHGMETTEEYMAKRSALLADTCKTHPGTVFAVTNEVGSGIVPESAETRLYRDLVGRCNQCLAAAADEVVLVSCGIPLILKNEKR